VVDALNTLRAPQPDHMRAAMERLAQSVVERGTGTKIGTEEPGTSEGGRPAPRKLVVRLAGIEPATLGLEVTPRRMRPFDRTCYHVRSVNRLG
jgi:hypothetical protein